MAKALGLSTSTVSRAFRDNSDISKETKERILSKAKEFNYQPNHYASNLREQRSKTIAVVVPELGNNFFSQAINGIEKIARDKGYHILIYTTDDVFEKEVSFIRHLHNGRADVKDITKVWKEETAGFGHRMLSFLQNHDEERIASAGNPLYALPAMVVSATLSSGPVMLYFGQEIGEPGKGIEGFGGDDNRTSIFDYWGVPEHQKCMNKGAFDGKKLSK